MIHEFDRGSSDRGFTSQLWRGFNQDVLTRNPRMSYMDKFTDFDEHFVASSADYVLTSAGSTATFAHDTTVGQIGVWLLDCDSSTAAQGGNLQFNKWLTALDASTITAFEVRCKIVDAATGPEFFAGLSVIDTAIISSSNTHVTDAIGFSSVTDNNVLLFGSRNSTAGAITNSTTSPGTLVDGTYHKLGFRVEYNSRVEVYFDGTRIANDVALSTLPDGVLVPSFVNQSSGTVDPILHLDWMRLATK